MIELNFPNPVREEKDLYGRDSLLEQIERVFISLQPAPVVVIGERRIGKTSLQNVVLNRLDQSNDPNFVKIIIEPRGLNSVDALAQCILRHLSNYLGKTMRDTGLLQADGSFQMVTADQFALAIEQLIGNQGNEAFLICVDEFDEILRQLSDSEAIRLEGMILYVVEKSNLPVYFFLTMTRLTDSQRGREPSPLIARAQIFNLPPLSKNDVSSLLAGILGNQFIWANDSDMELYHLAGGHPYFTKLLLAHIIGNRFDEYPSDTVVDSSMIKEAVNKATLDLRAQFAIENLYRVHFSILEKELLIFLAGQDVPIDLKLFENISAAWWTALRQLVSRHYLKRENNQLDFKIGFLRYWFRNWVEFYEEKERFSFLRDLIETLPPEIEVDEGLRRVVVRGQPVKLSAQEFRIMWSLALQAGLLLEREKMIEMVWDTEDGVTDVTVDTALYRLRKKIGDKGDYIETVQGQGFILHRARLLTKPQD